ncbi:peptidylprolyl isomerase fpr3 [Ophidiomyces ophidiicola]|nr:peptidylprolyl isomerase fpr3 [Ophidiomyces ophidiicola]KAI2013932.1 peptidylprolyl isomerase fpr3 [Ophidiomyces ophidiicola]KAI2134506.1 peptidylprolyl isomerase fpr3 [Ophidiomyces ophidiicola]KAI2148827.1 peptidylprolyl isomerase fpr3 [Ophidiomyces ophidiicola]KAI2214215.1 peptidylprolyl isomerase fpr3 [Ophidiomyces ophidiicola]
MSGIQPVALYAAKVPPGGILIPAAPNASAMLRITMAAIDPDALPEFEDHESSNKVPRATLKIVRPPPGLDLDDDDDGDEDDDSDAEEDEESNDEVNGGPSDPAKAKMAKTAALLKNLENFSDDEDHSDDSEDIQIKAALSRIMKGKSKAMDDDASEDSDSLELEEVVVCTLDPEQMCQQALDFVVAEDERIFFKVTGTHTVYLTGNYVTPLDENEPDEDDDDYDLSPDEDELGLMEEDDESDELDDMEDPRIMEIDTDEEQAPSKKTGKGKNKRAAEDSDENLDDMMSKAMKPDTNGEQKLSKKQQKKLKKNNGDAAEVTQKAPEAKQAAAKTDKKVQFAKNLEQGPTNSTQKKNGPNATDGTTGTLGVKEVQGVKIEDKRLGKGAAAKKGDRVQMRYIGKLENGNVFDCRLSFSAVTVILLLTFYAIANKSGKPFSFKLGSGEVIKGWDIGVAGMAAGAERRMTIPPHLAYGKKALPGIPANSKLIFDVKLLGIK